MAASPKPSAGLAFPLLASESRAEFESLESQFEQELQPKGVVERMLVRELVRITWEIQRLWPYKTVIINNSRLVALQTILEQLLYRRDFDSFDEHEVAAEKFSRGFFSNRADKNRVVKLLRIYQMDDEAAIEAEAFRLNAEDLERLDRMLAILTARFDKALRCLMDYQKSRSARDDDQNLDTKVVPKLVMRSSELSDGKRTEG